MKNNHKEGTKEAISTEIIDTVHSPVTQERAEIVIEEDVVTQDAEVAGGGVNGSTQEGTEVNGEDMNDANTKQVARQDDLENPDNKGSSDSQSTTDSDSDNTANVLMINYCKRLGCIGPKSRHDGICTRPLRKSVVFDVSRPEPINSVSHKVCLLQY